MYNYIHYLFPPKKRFFLKKTTFFIASDKFWQFDAVILHPISKNYMFNYSKTYTYERIFNFNYQFSFGNNNYFLHWYDYRIFEGRSIKM